MIGSPNRGGLSSTHIHGTHVPGGGAVHSIRSRHASPQATSPGNVSPLVLAVTAPAHHHGCKFLIAEPGGIMAGKSSWQLREGEQVIACKTGLLAPKHFLIGIT